MKNILNPELVVNSHNNKFGLVIEQKQARAIKSDLTKEVASLLVETYGLETVQTSEGLYLLIPNNEEGFIPVVLDLKVKPLDTDIETLASEFSAKEKEKQEKAKMKAEKAKKSGDN